MECVLLTRQPPLTLLIVSIRVATYRYELLDGGSHLPGL
jgi:hypothetical protein